MENELIENTEIKIPLTRRLPAKVAAFILFVLMAGTVVLSVIGAVVMFEAEIYSRPLDAFKQDVFGSLAWSVADEIYYARANNEDFNFEESFGETNLTCRLTNPEGTEIFNNLGSGRNAYKLNIPVYIHQSDETTIANAEIHIDKDFPVSDRFSAANKLLELTYALRYWIYVIAVLSLIALVVLFVFLMCASGHKKEHDGIEPSFITKIPLDLLATAVGLLLFFTIQISIESSYMAPDYAAIVVFALAFIICISIFLGFCISLATRIKLGKWWRNTVIYKFFHLIWRILRAIGRGIGYIFRNLPLIWKTALALVVVVVYSFISAAFDDFASRFTMLLLGMIIVFPVVTYMAIAQRKLQTAGRRLAKGDLSVQVDTRRMLWDFKEHGENLNSIGLGMTRAVDERMKSERMKTELITNVSHDIKTPLTSIINYTDLISKEESGNQKINEYVEVLSRQSERLKKLIEDLVEASKASTGNLDISLSPCDIGVLLAQTVGEYQSKLSDCALELVTVKPETPVMVMADGRFLWRVFDNIMNNVIKYAQPDTRVYLTLEQRQGKVNISLKNISKYPLNISAEELMERFVRGDSSRHTEGSGLGLSIARSLIELQRGSLSLTIDGDLFKVDLSFNEIN